MDSFAFGSLQNSAIPSLQVQTNTALNLHQVIALTETQNTMQQVDENQNWKQNSINKVQENIIQPTKIYPNVSSTQFVDTQPNSTFVIAGLPIQNNFNQTQESLTLPPSVQDNIWQQVPRIAQQSPNLNSQVVQAFLWIEAKLCAQTKFLKFGEKVAHVYNPLEYASDLHAHYISKYCGTKPIMFLGMNPGPFGMAQNGVPFGDTHFVRNWLQISGDVTRPQNEHPKRPIQGLQCTRSEVSGSRFWGLISKICGTPEQFFRHCFVHNYCPLVFLTKTGKNIIPPTLLSNERQKLEKICDDALLQCIRVVRAQIIVAIGKYAEDRVSTILRNSGDDSSSSIRVVRILHPSPASPQANSGWESIVISQLQDHGVLPYLQSTT